MATVVSYATGDGRGDGVVLELVVDDAVAEVLAEPERSLRAVVFTDLAGGKRKGDDEEPAADVAARLTQEDGRRRHNGKALAKPGNWEGPRFQFLLFLGDSRADWHGEELVGEDGRCALCHGAELEWFVYCLACQNCGREREMPTVPAAKRPNPLLDLLAGNLKGGKAGSRRKGKRKAKGR